MNGEEYDGMKDERVMIERAISIALSVHAGQVDKHGAPYVLHPLRVGLGASDPVEITAGILHDVVEDSDLTLDDLAKKEEFPQEVLAIVDALSRREDEPWEDYIDRVIAHPPAMPVKLRDLEQNMDARRIGEFGEFGGKDAKRFARYVWAWRKITGALKGKQ